MTIKEKDKTIVGYSLLIVGLILMFYSIFSVIGVFTGGEVPIEILNAEEKDSTTQTEDNPESNNQTSPNLGQIIEPMFPMFNAMIWLTFAFFILIAGARVARVGIKMMKASIPDVTIIKQDVKDIKDSYKQINNVEPTNKEKKGFFRKKNKK